MLRFTEIRWGTTTRVLTFACGVAHNRPVFVTRTVIVAASVMVFPTEAVATSRPPTDYTGVGGFARLRRSERSVFTPAAARSRAAAPATGIVTGGLLQLHLGLIRSTKNEEMRDETEEIRR